jgi:hypothetical protein
MYITHLSHTTHSSPTTHINHAHHSFITYYTLSSRTSLIHHVHHSFIMYYNHSPLTTHIHHVPHLLITYSNRSSRGPSMTRQYFLPQRLLQSLPSNACSLNSLYPLYFKLTKQLFTSNFSSSRHFYVSFYLSTCNVF